MRRLLGVMLMAGCATAPMADAEAVDLDRPFVLAPGTAARWAAAGLTIHFEQVVTDSRCPRGERCLVAGVARIRVRFDMGEGKASHRLELQLPDQPDALLPGQGATLTLLRLDPYPVSGQVVAPEATRATMVIRRAVATDR